MSYIYWLFWFALLPNLALWLWQFGYLKKYWQLFVKVAAASTLVAVVWDALAIHLWEIWSFPDIIGITLLDIPIEQYLFYILVSWLIVDITLILRRYGY